MNAAEWLGGAGGCRLALAALDSLCDAYASPRTILRYFGALRNLLMLENVHDLDREEAHIFSDLDPSDRRADEVCLLADGLAASLAACREAAAGEYRGDVMGAAA